MIGEVGTAPVVATVESYQYFGHDAVVRVRPEADQLPELVVRVTGGMPLEAGSRVGLSVQGSVVAWPIEERAHTHGRGPGHDHADTNGDEPLGSESGLEPEHGGAPRS